MTAEEHGHFWPQVRGTCRCLRLSEQEATRVKICKRVMITSLANIKYCKKVLLLLASQKSERRRKSEGDDDDCKVRHREVIELRGLLLLL